MLPHHLVVLAALKVRERIAEAALQQSRWSRKPRLGSLANSYVAIYGSTGGHPFWVIGRPDHADTLALKFEAT